MLFPKSGASGRQLRSLVRDIRVTHGAGSRRALKSCATRYGVGSGIESVWLRLGVAEGIANRWLTSHGGYSDLSALELVFLRFFHASEPIGIRTVFQRMSVGPTRTLTTTIERFAALQRVVEHSTARLGSKDTVTRFTQLMSQPDINQSGHNSQERYFFFQYSGHEHYCAVVERWFHSIGLQQRQTRAGVGIQLLPAGRESGKSEAANGFDISYSTGGSPFVSVVRTTTSVTPIVERIEPLGNNVIERNQSPTGLRTVNFNVTLCDKELLTLGTELIQVTPASDRGVVLVVTPQLTASAGRSLQTFEHVPASPLKANDRTLRRKAAADSDAGGPAIEPLQLSVQWPKPFSSHLVPEHQSEKHAMHGMTTEAFPHDLETQTRSARKNGERIGISTVIPMVSRHATRDLTNRMFELIKTAATTRNRRTHLQHAESVQAGEVTTDSRPGAKQFRPIIQLEFTGLDRQVVTSLRSDSFSILKSPPTIRSSIVKSTVKDRPVITMPVGDRKVLSAGRQVDETVPAVPRELVPRHIKVPEGSPSDHPAAQPVGGLAISPLTRVGQELRAATPATAWSPADIQRLTDQVVRALDQRIVAHRERMGRA